MTKEKNKENLNIFFVFKSCTEKHDITFLDVAEKLEKVMTIGVMKNDVQEVFEVT